MTLRAIPLLVLAAGCPSSDEEQWDRFNADDTLEVPITPGADPGEASSVDLTSTTGSVVVGSATVDPGSGPAGTEHEVWVNVADAYEDSVGKVLVRVDSGERGEEEFTLQRDSADHGAWWVALQSVGSDDESRTDVFHFELYTPSDEDVPVDDSGAGR